MMSLPISMQVLIKPAAWEWENVPLLPWQEYVRWQDQVIARRPEIYRIRRWGDPVLGKSVADIGVSNFQAIGLWNKANQTMSGVANYCRIPHMDVNYLYALQVEDQYVDKVPDWRRQKMSWLCKTSGTIYFWHASTGDWTNLSYIEWGTIALGGNLVQVEDIEVLTVKLPNATSKRSIPMARLRAFRMTDQARPLADLLAEGLVHRCFCAYQKPVPDTFGDSPKGIVYSPFWSPRDWTFISSSQVQPDAWYLPMEWLTK
jgi:hypothetical protein